MKNKFKRQISQLCYQQLSKIKDLIRNLNNSRRRSNFLYQRRTKLLFSFIAGFITLSLIAIYLTGRMTSGTNVGTAPSTIKIYTVPEKILIHLLQQTYTHHQQ